MAVTCENDVRQECLLLAPHLGCVLLRNNSGAFTNPKGRLVRFGLGHTSKRLNEVYKSSDLIGWRERDGRFLAFECKDPLWTGWRLSQEEQAQAAFMQHVARGGGIAAFITHPEQLRRLVV
jgi:hypothetical protein